MSTSFIGLDNFSRGVLGDITGANAAAEGAQQAADAQVQSSREANQLLKDIYTQNRADSGMQSVAGQYGLNALLALSGMPQITTQQVNSFLGANGGADTSKGIGYDIPTFSNSMTQMLTGDPGYQFRLDQGQQALERSAAARGGLYSGRAMKDINSYAQGQASQEYQNVWNRLANIAGIGQQANAANAQSSQNFGNQASQNILGAGNARASGYIAAGNAPGQSFNSLMKIGGVAAGFV